MNLYRLFTLCFFCIIYHTAQTQPTINQKITKDTQGATVRVNSNLKVIHLIFSADSAFEGAPHILRTLDNNNIKASFFLTGNCLRMKEHEDIIKEIINKEHYIGGHSDKHILYAPWDDRQHSLVSKDSLLTDLSKNMQELAHFGIDTSYVNYYLPPYEWYNRENVEWIESSSGQTVINFTSGITTAADYTTPDMKNYRSSEELINQLLNFEKEHSLNGSIILIHPGTHESRSDKLYLRLDEIITKLKARGYYFDRLRF